MPSQTRDAAIVGVHEYPLRSVGADASALRIKAECAIRALEDAGLTLKDVDAIYECGEEGAVPAGTPPPPEYLGITANITDTTMTGGSSFEFQAAHAKRAIASGKANVALLTYGSTPRGRGPPPPPPRGR